MYSLVSGVYSAYLAPQQLNLLVVGAQGVGKTTLLERLKVTQFERKTKVILSPVAATLPVNIFKGEQAPASGDTGGVGDFSTSTTNTPPIAATTPTKQHQPFAATPISGVPRRLTSWVCPAPPKYAKSADDDDEEDDLLPAAPAFTPSPLARRSSTVGSMESVELDKTLSPEPERRQNSSSVRHSHSAPPSASLEKQLQQQQEYDLKPGAKMLPLVKIRPTIGMNLGKNIQICGTKCNVMDLSGRLHHLWTRYYDDCDAVLFVWKLVKENKNSATDETMRNGQTNHHHEQQQPDDDDDSDAPSPVTYEQQVELLQQVRQAIPDDVPFCVVCHFDTPMPPTGVFCNQRYDPAPHILPHYHNPNTSVFLVNAATGQGIKRAMEWLIPVASQQQRVRERPAANALNDDVVKQKRAFSI